MRLRVVLVPAAALVLLALGCVAHAHVTARTAPPPPTVIEVSPPPPTVVEVSPPPPTVIEVSPPPPTVVEVSPPPPTVVNPGNLTPANPPPPTVVSPPPCDTEGERGLCPEGYLCVRHGDLGLGCRLVCDDSGQCAQDQHCVGAARVNRRVCVPR